MQNNLKILSTLLLPAYLSQVNNNLSALFENLTDAALSTDTFNFYTSVASVFSSKIEGEEIELDSYVKHKRFGVAFQPDYTKKIDDLYDAYTFAQTHALNKERSAAAHKILSKNILSAHQQGKTRTQNMYVSTADGRIEYVAASPYAVEGELEKLYGDIELLLDRDISIAEVFFFAAMIHLIFVKIHPWNDGNGRCARLIEKWFLAEKLGHKAWFIQSEKYYHQQHQAYYNNLRSLGLEYPDLDYGNALPFLLMLPMSLAL